MWEDTLNDDKTIGKIEKQKMRRYIYSNAKEGKNNFVWWFFFSCTFLWIAESIFSNEKLKEWRTQQKNKSKQK